MLSIVLISVIIPKPTHIQNIKLYLAELSEQEGDYEIILVGSDEGLSDVIDPQVRLVRGTANEYINQLCDGAAAAQGDVLFFLEPGLHLPPRAFAAIEHNLKLLPQTIGGNFHLKFSKSSPFTKLLVLLLKRWRYRGCYYLNSGVFIRADVYKTIGGLRLDVRLPDYDFVRRMEQYGPTLYLPQAITAPAPSLWQALRWLVGPILMRTVPDFR